MFSLLTETKCVTYSNINAQNITGFIYNKSNCCSEADFHEGDSSHTANVMSYEWNHNFSVLRTETQVTHHFPWNSHTSFVTLLTGTD